MKDIVINEQGYVLSPYFKDGTIHMEVSDEIAEMLSSFPLNKNWRYVNGEFILEDLMSDIDLKERRERECFHIIDNRSQMWYNRLTAEQRQELNEWYDAWLNVTKTHVIPIKPGWL